jgi:hypothetical protein
MRAIVVLEVPKCMSGYLKPTRDKIVLAPWLEPVDFSREDYRVINRAEVVQVVIHTLHWVYIAQAAIRLLTPFYLLW